jgi:hypothetical protein
MLNNIKSYGEEINEAAAALPKMPEFLKKVGAKTSTPHGGGWQPNPVANHWEVVINNTLGTAFSTYKTFTVDFYPNGTWEANLFPKFKMGYNNKLSFRGKYKVSSSAKSNLFGKVISGVEITSTDICVPRIMTYD